MIPFAEFVLAVRGWEPYPWQIRLAERCAEGEPPGWIVAPTGSGKTTTIDALVWALAVQADWPTAERNASIRTVWAIDRRILVDQVFEQSRDLADRLDHACDHPEDLLYDMARRLLTLAAAGTDNDERDRRGLVPLAVTRWRGGLSERSPLRSPFQPQIITSTVGQIGSRLLFRGYGVAERSLAVNAGLAACDTTVCLDEAHLAEPFRQTVAEIRRRRSSERQRLAVPDLRAITLTATPPADYLRDDAVVLGPDDYARLGPRWNGKKTLELSDPDSSDDALPAATAELLNRGHKTVACVVNQVLTARQLHTRLERTHDRSADVMLLIGPQRPVDREEQLCDHHAALFDRVTPERALIVVATQTFEVGLDADVTGMVLQSASNSAIVQRLGRLNRSGDRAGEAIVVRDSTSPLYADDEPSAWEWLEARRDGSGAIDVSVQALTEADDRPADSRIATAATLTDAMLAQLAQTSPRPAAYADPDVEALLRGADVPPATDVALVWRCDLRLDDDSNDGRAYRKALLKLAPPQPEEMLTLTLGAARRLLAARLADIPVGRALLQDADVEGGDSSADGVVPPRSGGPPAFLVRRGKDLLHGAGRDANGVDVTLSGLRGGDVLVLPCDLGGADDRGLDPGARSTADVARDLRPSGLADRPPAVRLNRDVLRAGGSAARWRRLASVLKQEAAHDGLTGERVAARLELAALPRESPAVLRNLKSEIDRAGAEWAWRLRRVDPIRDLEAESDPDESLSEAAWVLAPVRRSRAERDEVPAREAPPTLAAHAMAVTERARTYGEMTGMPEPVAAALELAARVHDHGKADPRIQSWFEGGIAPIGSDLIAKSVFGTEDPRTDRRARQLAGLPHGLRHEIASVAILADALEAGAVPSHLGQADRQLALHLIATHHGRGRPIPPVPGVNGVAPEPFTADLLDVRGSANGDGLDGWSDGAWFERFFALHERYGPWTLAYIEVLLVLADRTISQEGR